MLTLVFFPSYPCPPVALWRNPWMRIWLVTLKLKKRNYTEREIHMAHCVNVISGFDLKPTICIVCSLFSCTKNNNTRSTCVTRESWATNAVCSTCSEPSRVTLERKPAIRFSTCGNSHLSVPEPDSGFMNEVSGEGPLHRSHLRSPSRRCAALGCASGGPWHRYSSPRSVCGYVNKTKLGSAIGVRSLRGLRICCLCQFLVMFLEPLIGRSTREALSAF